MKKLVIFLLVLTLATTHCLARPVDNTSLTDTQSKSAFGPAFDEIVVESTLNVRRKGDNRQSRIQNGAVDKKTKREVMSRNRQHAFPFGSSAFANAQAQSHDAVGPFGKNFGASASGSQSQSLGFGPNGISVSDVFSATQQYRLPNGQVVNISVGNAFGNNDRNNVGANGAVVTVTGMDGKIRPFGRK